MWGSSLRQVVWKGFSVERQWDTILDHSRLLAGVEEGIQLNLFFFLGPKVLILPPPFIGTLAQNPSYCYLVRVLLIQLGLGNYCLECLVCYSFQQ